MKKRKNWNLRVFDHQIWNIAVTKLPLNLILKLFQENYEKSIFNFFLDVTHLPSQSHLSHSLDTFRSYPFPVLTTLWKIIRNLIKVICSELRGYWISNVRKKWLELLLRFWGMKNLWNFLVLCQDMRWCDFLLLIKFVCFIFNALFNVTWI
jgi:hypothetical protein